MTRAHLRMSRIYLSIVHKHRKASEPQRVGASRGLHHNDHCGNDATGKNEGLGA